MVSRAAAALTTTNVRRETRTLVGALIVFLAALIVTLLALAVSILRMDRVSAIADEAASALSGIAASASRDDLDARLTLLRNEHNIDRIEVYRGDALFADSGQLVSSAEVITRPIPGGRMAFYFDAATFIGGRRATLVVGGLATLATIAGLLILIVYLPKFVRPIEEMLEQARHLNTQSTDDDARYLVQTFRDAVNRLQQQENELEHLRDAATTRTPDVTDLARTLNRSFTSGFLSLDAAGQVVAINDAGRAIVGVAKDTPVEPFPIEALGDPAFGSVLQASLTSRVGVTRREVQLTKTGALVGVTTVPLFDNETFLGMLALFTDLTSFRAMEARLRDLESLIALGHVSAGIAHEFRNSLFTINGYLKMAERSATPDAATKIRSAQAETTKLATAIDALLNFARPLTFRAQKLDLTEVLTSVVERLRHEHGDVRFDVGGAATEINGDRELLERAMENIVRNAVDAVRQQHPGGGGAIAANVAREPHPTITIRDNGVGIDPEQASTLLLPFQSGKPHGFGLGLPLARKIVLHHGGSLSLTGEPGKGATVKMEFFA